MRESPLPDNPYYLVKVMDRQWAEKLLDGELFMQPLSAFGDLLRRGADSSNEFRGDAREGMCHSFANRTQSSFFTDVIDDTETAPRELGQIAECFLQERMYCLYCLEYSESQSKYIAPDRRLLDFGDTAVVIFDPTVFFRRLFDELLRQFGNDFWVGAKRVQYDLDLTTFKQYDEFTKTKNYLWQNEFRIALDISNGHADKQAWEDMTDLCRILFMSQGGRVDMDAKRGPFLVRIGDIRDACIMVSTQDLIDLELPADKLKKLPGWLTPIEPPRRPVVTSYKPVIGWN